MIPRLRFILPLIAVAAFAFSDPARVETDSYRSDQRIARITWKAACRISKYDCPYKSPKVRRSAILGEQGIRGAYWAGSPVVWLDKPVHGTQLWLTIFHEQVHYIQTANGVGDDWGRLLSCMMEREALDFTNAYALELKAPGYVRTLKVWRSLYNCDPATSLGTGMDGNEDTYFHR